MDIPHGGLNQGRESMPQIPIEHFENFLEFLRTKGISYNKASVREKYLKASQQDHNPNKVKAIMKKDKIDPVIISWDDYVVDGHHRWLAWHNKEKKDYIPCLRVKLNVLDLIVLMKEFTKNINITVSESVKLALRNHKYYK